MALTTDGLDRVDGGRTDAAERIDTVAHRLHVLGVDATPVAAEVVNRQPLRDWPNQHPVGDSVSAMLGIEGRGGPAVTVAGLAARPFPTSLGLGDLLPELLRRHLPSTFRACFAVSWKASSLAS